MSELDKAAEVLTSATVRAVKVNTDRLTLMVEESFGTIGYIILDPVIDSLETPVLRAEVILPPGWDPEPGRWYERE